MYGFRDISSTIFKQCQLEGDRRRDDGVALVLHLHWLGMQIFLAKKILAIRGPVKDYFADFFPLRGGGIPPPHSAKLFWAQRF